jgi:hypothetical protein
MNSSALLREADFRGWVSVAARFMRSSVARVHGRPLRWDKLYFRKFLAAVFFLLGALRGISPNRGRGWNRLRGGSRPSDGGTLKERAGFRV